MNAIHRPASLSRNIPNLTCSPALRTCLKTRPGGGPDLQVLRTHGCGALGILLVLLLSLAAAPSLWAQSASPSSVATDRADYPPGDTAVITGSAFQAGETVTLQVVHAARRPSRTRTRASTPLRSRGMMGIRAR